MAIHSINGGPVNNVGGVVRGSFTSTLLGSTDVNQTVNSLATRGYGGSLIGETGAYFKTLSSLSEHKSVHNNYLFNNTNPTNYTSLSGFTSQYSNSGNWVVYDRPANQNMVRYFIGLPLRYTNFTTTPDYNEIAELVSEVGYTYGDLAFTLTNRGLSLITLSGVPIASGGIYAHNKGNDFGLGANEWFDDTFSKSDISAHYNTRTNALIHERSVTKYTINGALSRAIVQHNYGGSTTGVIVYHQYSFNGPDVQIDSMFENNSSKDITVPAIGGLDFFFDRIPDGIIGFGEGSPNLFGPINASVKDYQCIEDGFRGNDTEVYMSLNYARDNRYGLCVSPLGLERQSVYLSSWRTLQETSETRRVLEYQKYLPITSGNRGVTSLTLRCINSTDWRTITAPYKANILSQHGGLKYTTNDWRMFLVSIIDNGITGFGSGNPYSIQEDIRLDNAGHTQYYLNNLNNTYQSGLGNIVYWNFEGRHPREGVYRMENDVIPPEVEANLTNILIPSFSGRIQYGNNVNLRNFNTYKKYHGLHRNTFQQGNQTQDVPLRLNFTEVLITASGVPRQLSKTICSKMDAGNYGTARYHVTGVFTGSIKLQYLIPNGAWTDSATITGPSTSSFSLYRPSEYVDTKWRFISNGWTAGTGICRLYMHYSSDDTFNFALNPSETAYSGIAYLQYKHLNNWIDFSSYKGIVFTAKDQIMEYSARPNERMYVHYTTPSGWAGRLVLEYNPSGMWLPAPGVTNGIIRQRDTASTSKSVLSTNFSTSVTGWRIRSSGTWASQANIIMGHWASEDKIRIIPTDWRLKTDPQFTGVIYSSMYEDNMIDLLTPPTQLTRSLVNTDFDSHYNSYKERFENVFNKGMTYFYADTTSRYYDEFLMLRLLRQDLGTNWQILPEYYNDYMLPYGGTYTTTSCVRSPIGTRQTRTLSSGNAWSNIPYPVFVAPLFTVSVTGNKSAGSVYLERSSGSLWQTIDTYDSFPVNNEYESNSYFSNTKYRVRTSPDFNGTVVATLQDNLGNNSSLVQNQQYIVRYNENDLISSYSISASGESTKPTPYFRGNLGPVVLFLQGTLTDGHIDIQKYSGGWQTVKTFTSIPTTWEEFPITQDENWRYKTGGNWNGSVILTMGQWRSKVPGYLTEIFRNIYGSGIESIVKIATDMPTSLAGSYYHYCFRNGFKPAVMSTHEASGLRIQEQYLNVDGSRK